MWGNKGVKKIFFVTIFCWGIPIGNFKDILGKCGLNVLNSHQPNDQYTNNYESQKRENRYFVSDALSDGENKQTQYKTTDAENISLKN